MSTIDRLSSAATSLLPASAPTETEATQATTSTAPLYAAGFSGGGSALAAGLSQPRNLGDIEALLATVIQTLQQTVGDNDAQSDIATSEKARTEALSAWELVLDMLGADSSLDAENAKKKPDSDVVAFFKALFDALVSFFVTAFAGMTGSAQESTQHLAGEVEEAPTDSEQVQEKSDEEGDLLAKLAELRNELRNKLIEMGETPGTASRVAGIGVGLAAGVGSALSALYELSGDARLTSPVAGPPAAAGDRAQIAAIVVPQTAEPADAQPPVDEARPPVDERPDADPPVPPQAAQARPADAPSPEQQERLRIGI